MLRPPAPRDSTNAVLWALGNNAARGALLGLACAIVVWLAGLTSSLDRACFDSLFRLRGTRFPSSSIVILAIDQATVARAGRYPLPRQTLANVVRKLTAAGVKTIAFDMLFDTHTGASADADFARACRAARRVVQAEVFYVPGDSYQPFFQGIQAAAGPPHGVFALTTAGKPRAGRAAVWAGPPLPALQSGAAAVGHINVYPGQDGVLRAIPNIVRYHGAAYPSLALAAAANFLGASPHSVQVVGQQVQVAGRSVPVDANGETLVNWIGGNNSFPTFSLNQLADGQVPLKLLKNRLVLIGVTAAGGFDYHATPFSPVQPAVELEANAIDDIVANRLLRRMPGWAQLGVLLLFGTLIGWSTGRRHGLSTVWRTAAFCLVLLLVAVVLLGRFNIYMQVGGPLLAAGLALLLVNATNYQAEWRHNWQATISAAALARGSALLAGGHSLGRLHTVIRETARVTLGADEVFLVLPGPQPADSLELPALLRTIGERVVEYGQVVLCPASARSDEPLLPRALRRRALRRQGGRAIPQHHAEPGGVQSGDVQQSRVQQGMGQSGALDGMPAAPQLDELFVRLSTQGEAAGAVGHVGSLLAVPLVSPRAQGAREGEATLGDGALIAVAHRAGAFSQREAALAESLARQVALAVENHAYATRLRSRIDLANRDLRDAYEVLTEQSTKLTAAVDSVDDALVITDEQGNAVFVNPAAGHILGEATPVLGQHVATLLAAKGLVVVAGLFEKARAETPGGDWKLRCDERLSGISPHSFRLLAGQLAPLQDHGTRGNGYMLIVSDVTAQRSLDSAKSDFVSFVAHELRTPLTTILGYASLLHEDNGSFTAVQRLEMSGAIINHSRRMNRMITAFLDISRAEAGRDLALRPSSFDLVTLCEQVIEAQIAALHGEEHFIYLAAPGTVEMSADRDRIEEVIGNLLSNAVKYSPGGGKICLAIAADGGQVVLSVSDQGMGMTTEQQAGLFEKFYRTEDALQSGIRGTGLGLFLVKWLVEAHQGTIAVESAQGKGSTFTVTMPQHVVV